MTPRPDPWPTGSQVLLRHVLRGRTWCALPVTVLADGPAEVVLRIHAGAEWLAAYDSEGARAHGWERRWTLRPTVWSGDEGTYVIEWDRWYGVAVFCDPATRQVRKWYVNCQDPLARAPWGFDTMDRELDVELGTAPDARPSWKDRDRFERLVSSQVLDPRTADLILREARHGRDLLADQQFRSSLDRWRQTPCDPPPGIRLLLSSLPLPDDLTAVPPPRA